MMNNIQTDELGVVNTADCWDHADQWQYMTACERTPMHKNTVDGGRR